ncbi:MAG: DMP19 family protein [Treponema sp.]|jgi:tetratricopeptide (TPR) repeat protein|nr:DMP19 family protein [Treponema sp.]
MNKENREALLAELRELHEKNEHETILRSIEKIAREEWGYDMSSYYARALNNLDRYEEALHILLGLEREGKTDGFWYFRVGYSLYYLEREAEAAEYFKKAIEFGDNYQDTYDLLNRSLKEAFYKESFAIILKKLKKSETRKLFEDSWDFLHIFLHKYFEIMKNAPDGEGAQGFNNSQHTLLAYHILYWQVSNGGFIQLIHNGYGGYLFDGPFSEIVKSWGALRTAEIVDAAKIVYDNHKEELERATTTEGFSELYTKIKDFEELETAYYEIMDKETEIIRKHIEENIHDFVIGV